ncbi:SNF2 helicase associated domain-containing protein [Alkalicoccus chagannorensis]|uniref:SNF2 helicase associated domain-containing protein n=1 Tax=Alkalicoccus chagannorensis TaxID=427072 RepID=UPI00147699A1|nr:SNF2 helicase associated domain-containing protein [Alkalicoccus chagannorensis]
MLKLNALSEEELLGSVSTPELLTIAKSFHRNGSVKELLWNPERHTFVVHVYRYQQEYKAEIEVMQDLTITSTACTCGSDRCVHIYAALLALHEADVVPWLIEKGFASKEALSSLSPREERRLEEALHRFHSLFLEEEEGAPASNREELQVQYQIKLWPAYDSETSGALEVELKIGPGRLYVVKEIRDFLESYSSQQAMLFTDRFSYYPEEHTFAEEDREILDWMYELLAVQDMGRTYFKAPSSRSFTLPPQYAKSFLEKMSRRDAVVIYDETRRLVLEEMERPFSFRVEEEGENMHLHWQEADECLYFGRRMPLCYAGGTFYSMDKDKQRIIEHLYYLFSMEGREKLVFTAAYLESLASVLLPQLREIGRVDLVESLEQSVQAPPLVPKLYIEEEGQWKLTLDIQFHYGAVVFRPFTEEKESRDTVLVRDLKQEYRLMSVIEDTPVKLNGSSIYVSGRASVLYFLSAWMPRLSELFEVYAPKHLQEMIHEPAAPITLDTDTSGSGWLDVSFELEGIAEEDVAAMMQALQRRESFFQLENGAYVPLEHEHLQGAKSFLEQTGLREQDLDGNVQLPLYQAFELEAMSSVEMRRSAGVKQLFQRLLEPEEHDFPLPAVDADMRDYQKRGYQWMTSLDYYGFGGILADDMGLGKTLQTIAFALGKKERGVLPEPLLIICPASVVYNWKKELERFAPHLKAGMVSGTRQERRAAVAAASEKDVLITSYPALRRDEDLYEEHRFSTLILDEAQNIKNVQTKTSRAVRSINCGTCFALSGTPIENSLEELYSIFRAALPGFFRSKEGFNRMTEEQITSRIRPFVLRRRKQDVLKELPEKQESVAYADMTQEQKTLYLGQLQLLQSEASNAIAENRWQEQRMQILAGLTRLRQICCHPGMFMNEYKGGSDKLEQLMEYTEEALQQGRSIVVFSQFTSMLSIIRSRFDQKEHDYFYLDGSTKSEERVTMAERFNNGEKDLFLVSLKAGGTGLNLTGGDTVILFDSWWNPAVEDQAADRVYRFGQKRMVQVIKMITAGTIEEKIHAMQEQKRQLMDRVVQTGETSLTSIGKEEIRELLQI